MFLLDSDTVIDVLRGRARVIDRLARISPDDVSISAITVAELWLGVLKSGLSPRRVRATESFIEQTRVLSFDKDAARKHARIRLEITAQPIGPHDLQIAATALVHDMTLVSSNVREFTRVPGLRVESWR